MMPSGHDYSEVRFGQRRSDGEEVVIKLRRKPDNPDPEERKEEKEWRHNTEFMLNLPYNPGIAKIHEVLEDESLFYIVMERAKGVDLFELLNNHKDCKITADAARELVQQLLQAVKHLHDQGAVHKDLKLENIVIDYHGFQRSRQSSDSQNATQVPTAFGRSRRSSEPIVSMQSQSIKIIDFDTVKEWGPSSPLEKDVLGTDQYISQEAYGGKYSPQSDVFAIGVIAYKLLTGKFPFPNVLFDDQPGENQVGSPKMEQIRSRLSKAFINWSDPVFQEHPKALDLMKQMLTHAEDERPTAAEALLHPWVNGEWSTFLQDKRDDGLLSQAGSSTASVLTRKTQQGSEESTKVTSGITSDASQPLQLKTALSSSDPSPRDLTCGSSSTYSYPRNTNLGSADWSTKNPLTHHSSEEQVRTRPACKSTLVSQNLSSAYPSDIIGSLSHHSSEEQVRTQPACKSTSLAFQNLSCGYPLDIIGSPKDESVSSQHSRERPFPVPTVCSSLEKFEHRRRKPLGHASSADTSPTSTNSRELHSSSEHCRFAPVKKELLLGLAKDSLLPKGLFRPLSEIQLIFDFYRFDEQNTQTLERSLDTRRTPSYVMLLGIRKSDCTKCALKFIPKAALKDGVRSWRAVITQIVSCKQTEHIGDILEVLELPDVFIVSMPCNSGGDLLRFLIHETSIPERECKRIIREIVIGLQDLHAMGLIHRNVKPQNIVFAGETGNTVKLVNFEDCQHWNAKALRACFFAGSPGFIAPETLMGWASPQSDLWAVGVILYILMTGDLPWNDDLPNVKDETSWVGSAVAMRMHEYLKKMKIDWSAQAWRNFPEASDLCKQLLEFDTSKRLASAKQVLKHRWLS